METGSEATPALWEQSILLGNLTAQLKTRSAIALILVSARDRKSVTNIDL